jgi:hypothetical protein
MLVKVLSWTGLSGELVSSSISRPILDAAARLAIPRDVAPIPHAASAGTCRPIAKLDRGERDQRRDRFSRYAGIEDVHPDHPQGSSKEGR